MIEIRPAGPEDRPALDELFAASFGHGAPAGFWEWKYAQTPGESRQRVAIVDGDLVAHAGALGLPARWEGGQGAVWQLVDFMGTTAGSGLRSALVEAGRDLLSALPREHDVPWIFGFPSERHFQLGRRTFGYRPLRQISVWSGPLPAARSAARVEISESCGEWAETIWSRSTAFGVTRTAAFLNWRYFARPDRYYRFYRLFVQGAEGLAVFGYAGREAQGVELWLPPEVDWTNALLAVVDDLRSLGMESWSFWPIDASQEALLRSVGAGVSDRRIFAGCRGRLDDPHPETRAERFTYAMGDYDLV